MWKEELKDTIDKEGVLYTFTDYSDWKEIKSKSFQTALSNYKKDLKAFQSVIKSLPKNQKEYVKELIIVHTGEDSFSSYINTFDFEDLNVLVFEYDKTPSFAGQINFGVEKATSDWVSFLEFDDEYSNIWFKTAKNYMEIYKDYDSILIGQSL
jgi:hypothetical protein